MGNICRPFLLYNDFLPPSGDIHEEWTWMSFGYQDAVAVGENLFSGGQISLEKMWECYLDQNSKLDGSYSSHIIWGFRNEPSGDDSTFWEQKLEYPFLFVSLIQIGDEIVDNMREKLRSLEHELNQGTDCRVITYLTLESSDLILVLLSKNYENGARIIDRFHNEPENAFTRILGWHLRYSFSVAGVYREFLNDRNQTEKLNGKVQFAYVHAIEKYPGSIANVYLALKQEPYQKYVENRESILGCDDELIRITGMPWGLFLSLYRDTDGILNHSSEVYKANLNGVTTVIGDGLTEKTAGEEKEAETKVAEECIGIGKKTIEESLPQKNGEYDEKDQSACLLSETLRNKCKNLGIYDENQEQRQEYTVGIRTIKRNFYQIINSVQKFETMPFHDYLFQPSMSSLYMTLDMAKYVRRKDQVRNYFVSTYEFIKSFNLYVRNNIRSDRQFTQSPDFSFKIYDTPVKLNAFYNAFIYRFKEYLNNFDQPGNQRHNYEFLACPGVSNDVHVRELFAPISKKDRLFLAEIPENQVYYPRRMMFVLGHEIGHFVGTDVRNREKRYECAKKIICYSVVSYLKSCVREISKSEWKKKNAELEKQGYWLWAEAQLMKWMDEDELENYSDKFYHINHSNNDDMETVFYDRKYHSLTIKMLLVEKTTKLIYDHQDELISYLVKKEFIDRLSSHGTDVESAKDAEKILTDSLKKYLGDFIAHNEWNRKMMTAESVVTELMSLFKECMADLLSILTLKSSLLDYVETLVRYAADQGMSSDYTDMSMIIRGALILGCMRYTEEPDLGYVWSDEEARAVDDSGNKDAIRMMDTLQVFIEDYMCKKSLSCDEKDEEDTGIPQKGIDVLRDYKTLMCIEEYLLDGKRIFARRNADSQIGAQGELIKVYNLFETSNVEELVFGIQRFIDSYLKDIRFRNRELAKEEEKSAGN